MKMKKLTHAFVLSLFFISFAILTSCSDDDDSTVTMEETIVDKAVATSNLSILVEALQKTDLAATLQADGPFTVFAPTNDAFQALLDSKAAWNSLDDVPEKTLKAVLLYHVVATKAYAANLTNNQELNTVNEAKIIVDLTSGVKLKTEAGQSVSVTTADIEASNGIIHIVDEVLLPETLPQDITDLAIATPQLSSLVAALQKTELVAALQADGPFTVFAPTNDAFQTLLDSNSSWNTLEDIPTDVLQTVLLFHVLNGKVLAEDLTDTYAKTLATGPNDETLSLQIEVTGGVKFNSDSKPISTNIIASNGVVHTIDKIMLPPNIVTIALNNGGFTSLVAALTDSRHSTNFVSVLSQEGPFTVFAPTNAAFQALLDSNNDWNTIEDIPIGTLDAVLKYHVVSGANVQSDELSDNQEITMLNNGIVTVDLYNGAKLETSSNQSVPILLTDVQGTNGVVHVIDSVLLP